MQGKLKTYGMFMLNLLVQDVSDCMQIKSLSYDVIFVEKLLKMSFLNSGKEKINKL